MLARLKGLWTQNVQDNVVTASVLGAPAYLVWLIGWLYPLDEIGKWLVSEGQIPRWVTLLTLSTAVGVIVYLVSNVRRLQKSLAALNSPSESQPAFEPTEIDRMVFDAIWHFQEPHVELIDIQVITGIENNRLRHSLDRLKLAGLVSQGGTSFRPYFGLSTAGREYWLSNLAPS